MRNKNGEYRLLKRTILTVFHVRFVFVLFETLGFCKSDRVVFPDLSVKGEFNNGNKLSIYLSNINFETTYSYISKKNFEVSLFSIYSLNSMDSQNPHICRMQKKWIQSLKRHSTQISESGETQRIAFLEKQKNIIAAL